MVSLDIKDIPMLFFFRGENIFLQSKLKTNNTRNQFTGSLNSIKIVIHIPVHFLCYGRAWLLEDSVMPSLSNLSRLIVRFPAPFVEPHKASLMNQTT